MKASIIILTRDRVHDLSECLSTLATQRVLPHEVILLDNSSDSATADYIQSASQKLPFPVRYLRGSPSLGICTSRNTAATWAQGDIVFFLDDDVVLTDREYVATILDIFGRDPEARIGGIAAPGQPSGIHYTLRLRLKVLVASLFLLNSPRAGTILPSGFRSWWPRETAWVSCLPGCAMAFRGAVLRELRFDPGFEIVPYATAEDQDFSYRVGRRWKLLWTSSTQVWHKRSRAGVRLSPYEHYLCLVHNHHRFMRKNLGRPLNHVAFWWAMVGVLLNCLVVLAWAPSRVNLRGVLGFLEGLRMVLPQRRGL